MEVAVTTAFALASLISFYVYKNAESFKKKYSNIRKRIMEDARKREHSFLVHGGNKGLEFKLYRLGYNIGLWQYISVTGSITLIIGIIAAWAMKNITLAVVVPLMLSLFIYARIQFAYQRQRARMEEQAELVLQIMAGLYKTNGKNMIRAIQDVIPSTKPPLRDELDKVIMDYNMGKPVSECLREFAERSDNRDIEVFVNSTNMAEIFGKETEQVVESTAGVIRNRIELREDLRNETTMQRGVINIFLMALPAAFALIWVYYPPARETLTRTAFGKGLIAMVISIEFAAWYLTKRKGLVENL
ncbi:MAG: type II secretion system F family protein [Bacillota bacterium]